MPQDFLPYLGSLALRSWCIALLALLAAFRLRNAAARHAVWSAVLFSMFLLPAADKILPEAFVPIPLRHVTLPPLPSFDNFIAPPAAAAPPSNSFAPLTPVRPWNWNDLLIALYGCVTMTLLVRWGYAYARVRAIVAGGKQASTNVLDDIAVAHEMAWPLPRVLSSDAARVPLTLGFFRPAVILPTDWATWDEWKLRAVLSHELAHVRRHDWAITALASWSRCVFWCNPLAWWLEGHLRALAEDAADDATLTLTGNNSRYAEVLLQFASAARDGQRLAIAGVPMARHSTSRRINRVLALRNPHSGMLGRFGWALVLAPAALVLYTAAAMQVAPQGPVPLAQENQAAHNWRQTMEEGGVFTATEAAEAEKLLAANPHDLGTRAKLIAYYMLNVLPQPRLDHIFWLIENHPASSLHGAYQMAFDPRNSPLNSSADYERGKGLWLSQVSLYPRDTRVLANAANFVEASDPRGAAELLGRARELDPANTALTEQLARLYLRSLHSYLAPSRLLIRTMPVVDAAFSASVVATLETSRDAQLLGQVGHGLVRPRFAPLPENQEVAAAMREAKERENDYGTLLLQRAQALEPDNPAWKPPVEPQPAAPVLLGSRDLAKLHAHANAAYPALARLAGVQGTVRLSLTMAPDGRVLAVDVISGPALLTRAAVDAVKQWPLEAVVLGGPPSPVTTIIDVPFVLDAGSAQRE